ncbi:hypothetical protein Vadar_007060 [Vaccinium darrowii]|uniref:Uncharacterized protein n=1 Tax=Vaccinium darrowii TaxID=229202 RepID=A0ACB7XG89_9ERIC|nr:hypothetical protein Vadar_007060 [Vaccinium darrowii]
MKMKMKKSVLLQQLFPLFYLVLILLQIPPSLSKEYDCLEFFPQDEFYGRSLFEGYTDGPKHISTEVDKALKEAGYIDMSWIVREYLIPTIRCRYEYKGGLTIFAPQNIAFGNHLNTTMIMTQVLPLTLDREAFKSVTVHSSFSTFDGDPRISVTYNNGNTGGGTSINKVFIRDWDIYNDGNTVVHGVGDLFHRHVREEKCSLKFELKLH